MGLDMYLEARAPADQPDIDIIPLTAPEPYSYHAGRVYHDADGTPHVVAAYWRKANQIHRWFVDEVCEGDDTCTPYPVSFDQLSELLKVCKKAIEVFDAGDTAALEELLPTQSGFFFGGTEYDEWYRKDLELTIAQIDRLLHIEIPARFTYQASW